MPRRGQKARTGFFVNDVQVGQDNTLLATHDMLGYDN